MISTAKLRSKRAPVRAAHLPRLPARPRGPCPPVACPPPSCSALTQQCSRGADRRSAPVDRRLPVGRWAHGVAIPARGMCGEGIDPDQARAICRGSSPADEPTAPSAAAGASPPEPDAPAPTGAAAGAPTGASATHNCAGLDVGSAAYPVSGWSLALTRSGSSSARSSADIPNAWFAKVKSWIETFCDKGFVAILRHPARGQRYVLVRPSPHATTPPARRCVADSRSAQGILLIGWPVDLASVKRLNDHLKQWIPVGRFLPHSGAALTLRPLEPHQGVPEMLGCCLQDEGQPHYTFEAKGFTREELVEGKLRYGLWHRRRWYAHRHALTPAQPC